jgi:hypothetical protein
MAYMYGRGIPVNDIRDETPYDHEFRPEMEKLEKVVSDDSILEEAADTIEARKKWLEERGIPETDVLKDRHGEFYYQSNEEDDGSVHYAKRRLPDEFTLIF